ncbi:helix-turn-helix domain-containing protein [Pseudonocardia xinjiangensis]|uniref:Helix-turn-helix domain-containing protein n=2 Tax=Pseudonocardia xinjiangensis TaxID=75289 RepID=A0ABX1RQ31_9PSEU|nr:helix-turn-helix domain-containing protein [Pseudonocardia xinjiangensis]NMH82488.1 helix-turn-helix domain-containing protein [Pseudonocardia xinjiangensis]
MDRRPIRTRHPTVGQSVNHASPGTTADHPVRRRPRALGRRDGQTRLRSVAAKPRGRLLTTSELVKRLRVSSRTIQRWRNEGWIKPEWTTIGGQARWIEEDVRAGSAAPGVDRG